MIRPTTVQDVPDLVALANETEVFKPIELATLQEVLDDYVRKPGGEGYHSYTAVGETDIRGFVCYGPNVMTDRTWDLYWIAVAKKHQSRGVGSELLEFAEADIQRQRGRLIVIETSSLPAYEPTRRFYLKHGYAPEATVPNFYAQGDSLIILCKQLGSGDTKRES